MAAKKKKPLPKPKQKMPGPKELGATLGVTVSAPLNPQQVNRLRKALPGYVGLLDDAARQLEEDADQLGLPDISPEGLSELHSQVQRLMAQEAVAEALYISVYHQRMQLDDRGMAMLQKITRRIQALKEDDSGLPARWKFLMDFMSGFRTGGGRPKKSPPENPPQT